MFWLKSCPRCHGDVYEEIDHYGRSLACLQCSHYLTLAEEAALRHRRPDRVQVQTRHSHRREAVRAA